MFLNLGLPIWDSAPVVPHYASVCCQVQESGFYQAMGQNDLWIAAIAIAQALPLVTKNRRHFDKISGLRLEVLCQ
jgi:predicted nucleic acid-binding protein